MQAFRRARCQHRVLQFVQLAFTVHCYLYEMVGAVGNRTILRSSKQERKSLTIRLAQKQKFGGATSVY
jgi:hypothetical protein